MTVQTELETALDAYIQANFTGTLAQISGTKLNLERLLEIQSYLTAGSGGGGGGTTDPTTFTTSTVCLTTALTESSIALTSAKKVAIFSRTNTPIRLSTTSGNTINTQNFEVILSSFSMSGQTINV
jgi:hypothetical protein